MTIRAVGFPSRLRNHVGAIVPPIPPNSAWGRGGGTTSPGANPGRKVG
jgi:hypothetical protein